MLERDDAGLSVLFLGGTGIISASSVREAAATGMQVTVVNRGRNAAERILPAGVETLLGDVRIGASLASAIGDRTFDVVVNFLSFDRVDALRMVRYFTGRTRQYIHVSSASIYTKPIWQLPITESTPVGPNKALEYASSKWRAERALLDAHIRAEFPVTIVRPSHTYDDANPPLPEAWTVFDRLVKGMEIPVHGDGTSLWTLTHAQDFAVGMVGLFGNPRALGEIFNITSADVYTWDQVYQIIAEALGVSPRLVHVTSEMFQLVAPEWFWSAEMVGDIGHSAVFDTKKIRTFVPGFAPKITFHRAATRMVHWYRTHPASTRPDAAADAVLTRIVAAYHDSRSAFAAHTPLAAEGAARKGGRSEQSG
jgi:nucleoside-diphosphate-sugar epimerase